MAQTHWSGWPIIRRVWGRQEGCRFRMTRWDCIIHGMAHNRGTGGPPEEHVYDLLDCSSALARTTDQITQNMHSRLLHSLNPFLSLLCTPLCILGGTSKWLTSSLLLQPTLIRRPNAGTTTRSSQSHAYPPPAPPVWTDQKGGSAQKVSRYSPQ